MRKEIIEEIVEKIKTLTNYQVFSFQPDFSLPKKFPLLFVELETENVQNGLPTQGMRTIPVKVWCMNKFIISKQTKEKYDDILDIADIIDDGLNGQILTVSGKNIRVVFQTFEPFQVFEDKDVTIFGIAIKINCIYTR